MGDRTQGWGAAGISAPTHLQPFYRAEFGSKEGDFRVTEFAAEFAQFAEPVGRTSITVPVHNHPGPPHRREDRPRRRRPRACAGGGSVSTLITASIFRCHLWRAQRWQIGISHMFPSELAASGLVPGSRLRRPAVSLHDQRAERVFVDIGSDAVNIDSRLIADAVALCMEISLPARTSASSKL